jgi:hypothetical protein
MERYPWGLVGAKTREEWDAFARNGFLVADSLPLTFRILTDPSDRVWLVDPAASADPAALGFFQVIDADGRWLGRVDVPLRIDPVTALRIGEDRIAVVERDELDVEHVRVYLIRRGG